MPITQIRIACVGREAPERRFVMPFNRFKEDGQWCDCGEYWPNHELHKCDCCDINTICPECSYLTEEIESANN